MASITRINRRDFFRTSFVLSLSTLGACSNQKFSPTLRAPKKLLPLALTKALPDQWKLLCHSFQSTPVLLSTSVL